MSCRFSLVGLGICVASIVVSIFLAYLAVPRMIAAFIMIPGSPTLQSLRQRERVTIEELREFIETREDAAKWIVSPQLHSDLALARLTVDEFQGSNADNLSDAIDDLYRSVNIAPANPYAWVRLSLAHRKNGSEYDAAANALGLSLRTGPNERALLRAHLYLGLDLWQRLSEADRSFLQHRIRLAVSSYGMGDLIAASHNPRRLRIVRMTLSKEPHLLEKFDKRWRAANQE